MTHLVPVLRPVLGSPFRRASLYRAAGEIPSWHIAPARTGTVTDLISGSQIITFTNSSPAWGFNSSGLLVQPSANVPFIEYDPATGTCLGWRVWDAVTNLMLRSEEFDVGSNPWLRLNILAFGSGSIANAIAAPNEQITADFICEDTTTNIHRVSQTVTVVSGTTYTASVFAKSSNRHLCINANSALNARATFNLSTGAITVGIGSAAIQALPNGWYRCSVTGTAPSSAAFGIFLQINSSPTAQDNNYTGDGTSGLYLWGAQLNTGATLAPYVPTGALTASSTADVASIRGAAFAGIWNQAAWTVYSDSTIAASQIKTQGVWEAAGGTYASSLRQPQGTANQFRAVVGGTFSASPGTGGLLTAGTARAAVAAIGAAGRLQVGDAGSDITSANAPDPTVLWIGNLNSATQLNGYIRELAILKSRRPNANLQAMTQ